MTLIQEPLRFWLLLYFTSLLCIIMRSENLSKIKEQLETIRMRRHNLKETPVPEIIPIFRSLQEKHRRQRRLAGMRN